MTAGIDQHNKRQYSDTQPETSPATGRKTRQVPRHTEDELRKAHASGKCSHFQQLAVMGQLGCFLFRLIFNTRQFCSVVARGANCIDQ